MGIQQGHSLIHWNYFLAIESDIDVVSRFIEPCEDNYQTYSQELARILIASTSEIDVLLKGICEQIEPAAKADNIGKYETVIRNNHPQLFEFKLHIPRWGLVLKPWTDWAANQPPLWWTACNKVKHHRDAEYKRANLKHTLNSIGALFIVNLYFHREHAEQAMLLPMQKLFRVDDTHFGGTTFNDVEFGIKYVL
jgi:hypothetical protein